MNAISLPSWLRPEAADQKVHTAGTHRVRGPEETWATVQRVAPKIGLTRIAEITHLDDVGIPVALAFRPLARTLSVSAGKGLTSLLAKVSAGMESIELWHAEHHSLPMVRTSAAELDLPYSAAQLAQPARSTWTDRVRCAWVAGRTIIDGASTYIPEDCISQSSILDDRSWAPPHFLRTSNGLASGNSIGEATLHGLLEVIERDTLAEYHAGGFADRVPLPSGIATVDFIFEAFVRAGNKVRLLRLPNRFGVPCFHAMIRNASFPLTFTGAGCHVSAEVAACRALTEAAQNRLGVISGSRDDLDQRIYKWHAETDRPSSLNDDEDAHLLGASLADQIFREKYRSSLADDVMAVAETVFAVTGSPPVMADLTRPEIGVPVARVIAAGLRFDARTVFGRSTAPEGAR